MSVLFGCGVSSEEVDNELSESESVRQNKGKDMYINIEKRESLAKILKIESGHALEYANPALA